MKKWKRNPGDGQDLSNRSSRLALSFWEDFDELLIYVINYCLMARWS